MSEDYNPMNANIHNRATEVNNRDKWTI